MLQGTPRDKKHEIGRSIDPGNRLEQALITILEELSKLSGFSALEDAIFSRY
jgi:hypothetical protein